MFCVMWGRLGRCQKPEEELLEVKSEEEAVSDGVRRRVEIDIRKFNVTCYIKNDEAYVSNRQINLKYKLDDLRVSTLSSSSHY